jgi:hypothetical protein
VTSCHDATMRVRRKKSQPAARIANWNVDDAIPCGAHSNSLNMHVKPAFVSKVEGWIHRVKVEIQIHWSEKSRKASDRSPTCARNVDLWMCNSFGARKKVKVHLAASHANALLNNSIRIFLYYCSINFWCSICRRDFSPRTSLKSHNSALD